MTGPSAVAAMTQVADSPALPATVRAGIKALLDIIADLCPDHFRCTHCGVALCVTCGLGDSFRAADDCIEDHCDAADCICGPCRDEMAQDYADEQRADIARFGA